MFTFKIAGHLCPGLGITIVHARQPSKATAQRGSVDVLRRLCANKGETLKQSGEEQEELHPGKALSQTYAFPWQHTSTQMQRLCIKYSMVRMCDTGSF